MSWPNRDSVDDLNSDGLTEATISVPLHPEIDQCLFEI
jgi:hypothetical protein